MIVLKSSIAMNVGMVLSGLLLFCFLLFALVSGLRHDNGMLGVHSVIFALLALAALITLSAGMVGLFKRTELAITIEDDGIRLPVRKLFSTRSVFVARANILAISKHESIKGRLIEISTKTGEKMLVPARHYCELDEFLSHCKVHGFPVG